MNAKPKTDTADQHWNAHWAGDGAEKWLTPEQDVHRWATTLQPGARVLDLGAEGIVFPLIRDAEDAEKAVASLHYPPRGTRGFGPFIAHSAAGTDLMGYRAAVDGTLTCCLLVETREAVEHIEEICAVPGIDLLVPAQFDLSTDLGITGQFDHPDFLAALSKVEAAAQAAGIPLGNAALNAPQAESYFAREYRVIAGFDVLWRKAKAAEAQAWVGAA